jgi:hypothetical protein
MTAKKLDDYIVNAFKQLGFTDKEIIDGCWLLERKGGNGTTSSIWVAYHKFLERAALKGNIFFKEPKVLNCNPNEVALFVEGILKEVSAWSIGEASDKNLTKVSGNYRWAMAEKRAKDRVILKLLGLAGDVYSEEESDDFKNNTNKATNQEPTLITQEQIAELKKLGVNEIKLCNTFNVKSINDLSYNQAIEAITLKTATNTFPDAKVSIKKAGE